MFGINLDPLNPGGAPEPATLRAIGLTSVRFVLRPGCLAYLEQCRRGGLEIMGVIARESGEPEQYQGWGVDMIEVGNEMDVRSPSSWSMAPEEFWSLWYQCRYLFPDVPLVIGGMASGNPYRAEEYCAVEGAYALALHPYGKDTTAARALIRQYKLVTGIDRVLVTEWNRPASEIGEFARMLAEETAGSWWYAWSNGMNPGFGLDEPGKLDAMKGAIMTLSQEAANIEQRLALLEKQQAMTVEVLKLILQGRWTGEMPHAEALLKAINPGDTDWTARPFA